MIFYKNTTYKNSLKPDRLPIKLFKKNVTFKGLVKTVKYIVPPAWSISECFAAYLAAVFA